MSSSEKTALLPSSASGSDLVRDADGGEVIDIVPDGATGEDFASRPVGQRVSYSI
jgi:hypothetical protein